MSNKNKGFTLIEVIVSMAIFSIIFIPLLGIFSNGYLGVITMGHRTKAVEEGKKIIDIIYEAKNTNYSIAQLDIEAIITINNTDSNYVVSLEEYNDSYSITGVTMCRIKIEISYDNGTKSVYQSFLLQ